MENILSLQRDRKKLKAVLFDFDGTISTLRFGWEKIMEPLMLEMIGGDLPLEDELIKEVREYIDLSTGIQTYYQMKWLSDMVIRYKRNPMAGNDPWWYKEEYNKRLMKPVEERISSISEGKTQCSDFLIKGCVEYLKSIEKMGIGIYVASGTDHPDVLREAEILGVKKYFKEILGAPVGSADCSKEAVLRKLIKDNKLNGTEVLVVGDGKVEIALGREVGAITLGVASNEEYPGSVNPVKREKLIKAGAHAIIGDYMELKTILNWMNNIE